VETAPGIVGVLVVPPFGKVMLRTLSSLMQAQHQRRDVVQQIRALRDGLNAQETDAFNLSHLHRERIAEYRISSCLGALSSKPGHMCRSWRGARIPRGHRGSVRTGQTPAGHRHAACTCLDCVVLGWFSD
jgi:hypothetical protein